MTNSKHPVYFAWVVSVNNKLAYIDVVVNDCLLNEVRQEELEDVNTVLEISAAQLCCILIFTVVFHVVIAICKKN